MKEKRATDPRAIVQSIADSWRQRSDGAPVIHEMISYPEGRERGRKVRTATTQQLLSDQMLEDVLRNLQAWARELNDGGMRPNTVAALRSDLAAWCEWCHDNREIVLPASQDAVADYLESLLSVRKLSTLRRYAASIGILHNAAGLSNPSTGAIVKARLKRISEKQRKIDEVRRANEKKARFEKRQAEGLREKDLLAADALFDDSLLGLRDRALVWLAFDTLARSAELIKMRVEDLRAADDGGLIVKIPHSKSDQYGEGQLRYISPHTATRLNAWLRAAQISEGALFRGVRQRYRRNAGEKQMDHDPARVLGPVSRQTVYRVIRRCATMLYDAGYTMFKAERYSAHSTRVGAAQDMIAEGLGMPAVQQAGGWKSDKMPAQYGALVSVLDGGSAQLARKRGRAPTKKE